MYNCPNYVISTLQLYLGTVFDALLILLCWCQSEIVKIRAMIECLLGLYLVVCVDAGYCCVAGIFSQKLVVRCSSCCLHCSTGHRGSNRSSDS